MYIKNDNSRGVLGFNIIFWQRILQIAGFPPFFLKVAVAAGRKLLTAENYRYLTLSIRIEK